MENVVAIYNWFVANWSGIVAAIASVIGTASVIVKLTPTLKDDDFLLPIIKFLSKYIAMNVEAPKERPTA